MKFINKLALTFLLSGLVIGASGFLAGAKTGIYIDKTGVDLIDNETHTITETNLEPITTINIDLSYSNIHIVESDKYGINICYTGAENEPVWSLENGVLKIRDRSKDWTTIFSGMRIGFYIDNENSVEVYIPAGTKLDDFYLKTSSGNIGASHINSPNVKIVSSYGKVTLQDITSDVADISMSSGNFSGSQINSPSVKIVNSYGNITIQEMTSDTVKASLSSGSFTGSGITCDSMEVVNTYGKVTMSKAVMDTLDIDMSSGNLNFDEVNAAQYVNIKNSYGSITTLNCGFVDYTANVSSGNLIFSGVLSGESNIDSSYGSVTFNLTAKDSDYSCNLKTSYGKVRVDNKVNKDSESYYSSSNSDINMLDINASSGDIAVNFNS